MMDFDSNWDCLWSIALVAAPFVLLFLAIRPGRHWATFDRYRTGNQSSGVFTAPIPNGTIGGINPPAPEPNDYWQKRAEHTRRALDNNPRYFPEDDLPPDGQDSQTDNERVWAHDYWQYAQENSTGARRKRARNDQSGGTVDESEAAFEALRHVYDAVKAEREKYARHGDVIDGEFYPEGEQPSQARGGWDERVRQREAKEQARKTRVKARGGDQNAIELLRRQGR